MVYKGTAIYISDNSGVNTMKILQVYSFSIARVGDILLAVIREKYKLKSFVKKKFIIFFYFPAQPKYFDLVVSIICAY